MAFEDIKWRELKFSCVDCGASPEVKFIEAECRHFAVLAWLSCHGEQRLVTVTARQVREHEVLGTPSLIMQVLASVDREMVEHIESAGRAEIARITEVSDHLAKFLEATK